MKTLVSFLLSALLLVGSDTALAEWSARDLRCESRVAPLGIGTSRPLLSWRAEAGPDPAWGQREVAYQILVATSPDLLEEGKVDLWNSGKQQTGDSVFHPYAGKPLAAQQVCFWKVRIWDVKNKPSAWSEVARFSVGLLTESDWKANWIAIEKELPPGPVLDRNGFHSQGSPKPDTTKWVQVDLGELRPIDSIQLWPARPLFIGETGPAFLFPLRFRVEVSLTPDFAQPVVIVDKTTADLPSPGKDPLPFSFSPQPARYVRVSATRLAHRKLLSFDDYCFAIGELEVFSKGANLAKGKPVTASDTTELGTEWRAEYLTDGRHLGNRQGQEAGFTPPIYFRKEFAAPRKIRRAMVHATALGAYELHINGKRVGNDHLAPLWTHYGKRVLAQTYDVTGLVREGSNAVGAILGDGWYRMRVGWGGFFGGSAKTFGRSYGDAIQRLRMQLEIEFSDGTRQTVITDPSWRWTQQGAFREASIYDGSFFDGTIHSREWAEPGFAASEWKSSLVLSPTWPLLVEPQTCEPISTVRKLDPIKRVLLPDGSMLFDFGQNVAGVCRLVVSGKPGQVVKVKHAQALDGDGNLYIQNLWGAAALDTYRLSGKRQEMLAPLFTYHGFRYARVEGLEGATLHEIKAEVWASDLKEQMSFETSDSKLNQLWETIVWTYRGNLVSVVTDCAGRDERLGWQGDGQSSWQTLSFAFGMNSLGKKWFNDMVDSRGPDKIFNVYAPNPTPGLSPGWSDAGVLIPWWNFVNTGDRSNLELAYPSAREYVDAVAKLNPSHVWENHRGNDFNDWLDIQMMSQGSSWGNGVDGVAPKNEKLPTIPKRVFATAVWARSARILGWMARELGREEDATTYLKMADEISREFRSRFVKEDGTIEGNTQSTYALALACGVLNPVQEQQARKRLILAMESSGGKLTTGIQTSKFLLLGLSRAEKPDLAYAAAMHPEMPSWRFMLDQGATTIWERFDSYRPGLGFNPDRMNDLNHVGLSSVGEWMIRTMAGLEPDETKPGYRHFWIRPQPPSHLTSTKAVYQSILGPIEVSWKKTTRGIQYEIFVPPGATATFVPPGSGRLEPTESRAAQGRESEMVDFHSGAKVVRKVQGPSGRPAWELPSGRFRVTIR